MTFKELYEQIMDEKIARATCYTWTGYFMFFKEGGLVMTQGDTDTGPYKGPVYQTQSLDKMGLFEVATEEGSKVEKEPLQSLDYSNSMTQENKTKNKLIPENDPLAAAVRSFPLSEMHEMSTKEKSRRKPSRGAYTPGKRRRRK